VEGNGLEAAYRWAVFFFWGGDCRFTDSVDVYLRGDKLDQLDEFPSKEEIFPLQRLPFHNIFVAVPSTPEPFLARCYGPSWAEEAVVWSHSSRGRELLRVSLRNYMCAVHNCGYVVPVAAASADLSLAMVDLNSEGELRDLLWNSLGWASPYMVECNNDNSVNLEMLQMLGFESRTIALPAVEAAAESHTNWLEMLRLTSNAFIEQDVGDAATPSLHAVGTCAELDLLEQAVSETAMLEPGCLP